MRVLGRGPDSFGMTVWSKSMNRRVCITEYFLQKNVSQGMLCIVCFAKYVSHYMFHTRFLAQYASQKYALNDMLRRVRFGKYVSQSMSRKACIAKCVSQNMFRRVCFAKYVSKSMFRKVCFAHSSAAHTYSCLQTLTWSLNLDTYKTALKCMVRVRIPATSVVFPVPGDPSRSTGFFSCIALTTRSKLELVVGASSAKSLASLPLLPRGTRNGGTPTCVGDTKTFRVLSSPVGGIKARIFPSDCSFSFFAALSEDPSPMPKPSKSTIHAPCSNESACETPKASH